MEIARWRLDNSVERYLGRLADSHEFFKKIYVLYYKIFDRKYYLNGIKMLNKTIDNWKIDLQEYQRKTLVTDMIYSLHRYGCMFDEYFLFDFPNRSKEERENYITDKIRYVYYDKLNVDAELFLDKGKTYERLKRYYKREMIVIDSLEQSNELKCFIKRYHKVITKPQYGGGGKGVSLLNESNIDEVEKILRDLLDNGPIVVEQYISQAEEMKRLHPNSVNTVRVATIRLKESVLIWFAYLHVGKGGAIVDNIHQGGFSARIDARTGIINSVGYEGINCKKTEKHPDTNEIFQGFQIPQWNELLELSKCIAMEVDKNVLISWDFAYSEDGWVLVEGNTHGQLSYVQFLEGHGLRYELDKIISEDICNL